MSNGMTLGVLFLAVHDGLSFLVRVAALCLLPLRHNPQTAMAWLLVILFWPLPGGLLYLFLGSTRLPRERKDRHEKAVATLRKAHQRVWKKDPDASLESLPEPLARFARLGRKLGEWPIVQGNAMTYFDAAPALFESMVRDIDKSRHHIDLLFYIFVVDPSTEPLVKALKRAAARGVECRLLVDALGSKLFLKRDARDLREAGVQVVEALPLGRLLRRNRLTARYDLRNHRKLALMDAEVGYMGSHNVTDPTYGGKAGGRAWHDLTIRLEGPVVSQLEGVFLEDWFVETGEIPPEDRVPLIPSTRGEFVLQTVPSGPAYATENFQRLVTSALFEARKRVVITTPYLVPDDGLLQALEVAVLNGANVDLIVPEKVDQLLVGNASKAYYGKLIDLGVSLHLYKPGILHSKTMTVDDCLAFFGSSNFDIRSFALNFELNMILYGRQEALGLLKIQESYLAASRRLEAEEWRRIPAWKKSLHGMAKLLSPIL